MKCLYYNLSGDCDVNAKECVCTEETLAVKHAKCIDDTICSMWCQVGPIENTIWMANNFLTIHLACTDVKIFTVYLYFLFYFYQIKERKATGKCEGQHNWECVCKSAPKDKDNEVEWSK